MARADRTARLALWAAMAAFASLFGTLSVLRHRSFETGRFDLGNLTQAVWATAHGHPLHVTNLRGEQVSRLGSHFEPVLFLFAALWRVWPSPDSLLVVQSLALALGALPVFLLARKHLESAGGALCFALAYLLYPATTWLALNEFHPGALATPALLFAIWYLDEDRLFAFALCGLLAACCREEMALAVAGLGVWYALVRNRRAGAAIAVVGVAWTAFAVGVVIHHFSHGGGEFSGRYDEARGAAADPVALARLVFDHAGVHYLLDLVLPLAALCLLSPVALAALPMLALNLLSATPTQTSIHFHYTAAEIPPLVAAAVLAAGRAPRSWRMPLAGLVLAASLAGNYRLGAIPWWQHVPGGETLQANAAHVSAHDRVAARALDLVPSGAVVSATNSLGGHLSARRRILSFPLVQDATWVAADLRRPSMFDRIGTPHATAAQVASLRRNPDWRVVFDEDGVVVLERNRLP